MFTIKNSLDNKRIVIITMLFATLSTAVTYTMEPEKKSIKSSSKKSAARHEDEYFVYNQTTNKGIWVNKQLVNTTCKSIQTMIEDIGDENLRTIALNFPFKTIQLGFAVLENKININKLSLQQLINVGNLFDFLDVTDDIFNTIKYKIKIETDKDIRERKKTRKELKSLNPNIQKDLTVNVTIKYLKHLISKKYPQEKKIIPGYDNSVNSVTFNHSGTHILVGCNVNTSLPNFMLWNITDLNNITHQNIIGTPTPSILKTVNSAQFNNDDTFIATGSTENVNNLMLWKVSEHMPFVNQVLEGHSAGVTTIAFNHQNNKLISGSAGTENNLILWDIADTAHITHQSISGEPIVSHPDSINTVEFSPDDKYIISGCSGANNNLIIWNIEYLNHITSQELKGHPNSVNCAKVTPNGDYIISCCSGNQNNLIIWDTKTRKKIKNIASHTNSINTLAISHNGKKYATGGEDGLIIIWDITNPYNIIVDRLLTGHKDAVLSIAFSPDDTQLVSSSIGTENNFIVWNLVSEQEKLIKQLSTYTAEQVQFIYSLCIQSSYNRIIQLKKGGAEEKIFLTLPPKMQELITHLFFSHHEEIRKSKWFGK